MFVRALLESRSVTAPSESASNLQQSCQGPKRRKGSSATTDAEYSDYFASMRHLQSMGYNRYKDRMFTKSATTNTAPPNSTSYTPEQNTVPGAPLELGTSAVNSATVPDSPSKLQQRSMMLE